MTDQEKMAYNLGFWELDEPNPYKIGSNLWVKWMYGRRHYYFEVTCQNVTKRPIANDN